jgi:hypothetical protein
MHKGLVRAITDCYQDDLMAASGHREQKYQADRGLRAIETASITGGFRPGDLIRGFSRCENLKPCGARQYLEGGGEVKASVMTRFFWVDCLSIVYGNDGSTT